MDKIKYIIKTPREQESEIVRFISLHGDDPRGIISDEEFDKLFDLVSEALEKIGKFSEDDTRWDADFISSRYVDKVSCVTTVVNAKVMPKLLIESGIDIIRKAHRPLCVSFDCEGGYLSVFPDKVAFGNLSEDQLDVPLSHKK